MVLSKVKSLLYPLLFSNLNFLYWNKNVRLNTIEKRASDKQLILHFMDDDDERANKIVQSFDVGQKINSTSVSGLAATEFYGNFDILYYNN